MLRNSFWLKLTMGSTCSWIVVVAYHVSCCTAELNYLGKYLPHSCTLKYVCVCVCMHACVCMCMSRVCVCV